MHPAPGPENLRDVAVGPSRAVAAGTFGEHLTDARVTSYDDFSTEIDLAEVRTLALVGGTAASAVLASLSAATPLPTRILVSLDGDGPGRQELEKQIAANPDLPPVELVTPARPASKRPASSKRAPAAQPRRLSRRLQALLAISVAAAAVVVVVLVLIGRSSLGSDGVLVTLLALVVVLQVGLGVGLVGLLRRSGRLQHELAEQLAAQRQQLTRESTRNNAKVLKELERVQAQTLALAGLVSRIGAGLRERTPSD